MASLPTELWLFVFEYMDPHDAPACLARLARTSKFLWDIVTPILYHTVHFRRSSLIYGFRNGLVAHPTLATHVRILIFARGVDIPLDTPTTWFMLPVRARSGTVFGPLTNLAGVHVHERHLSNPSNGSSSSSSTTGLQSCIEQLGRSRQHNALRSVGSWLANPKPLVRNLLITFEDGRMHNPGHSLERSPVQLPPTPETLHLEHIELSAKSPFKGGAHGALRNVSAAVCLGDATLSPFGTLNALKGFLMSLCTVPNLSRARIFFPSASILRLATRWHPFSTNRLTEVLSDARIQLVVYDFGSEGYRTAVYAEMCGDDALWSLGDSPTTLDD